MDNSETRPLDTKLTIRTSEHGWLQELAKAYRVRRDVLIVDDANAGVDPSTQSLLSMGLRSKLSRNEWIALVFQQECPPEERQWWYSPSSIQTLLANWAC